MSATDVLVVGAGPVGLALAYVLRTQGVGVRIIDSRSGPSGHSGALVVHCRTQELLDGHGLREPLAAEAVRVHGMAFARGGRRLSEIRFDLGAYPALSLPQSRTEHLLREALARRGTQVEWESRLTELTTGSGAVCAVVNGSRLTARFVAGCDGAHSTVRHLLGIPFAGEALPETLWMSDCSVDWDVDPGHAWQFLTSAGMVSAIPMPGNQWRLVAMAPGAGDPDPDFFAAAAERCLGRPVSVRTSWISTFRVNCRLAQTYGAGRVLLAGDAAHVHSPIGGQGMNVGIQDALDLGGRLATAVDAGRDDVLFGYEAARRPVAGAVIRDNARITRLAMSRRPAARVLRDQVLPNLLRFPPVARRAGLRAAGLA